MSGRPSGVFSQMVERLPKIAVSDLKPGDAVVVSGGAGDDKSHLTAINATAGSAVICFCSLAVRSIGRARTVESGYRSSWRIAFANFA